MSDGRYTSRQRVSALVVAAGLAAAVALPVTALASDASVEVSFRVLPSIGAQVDDDGLTVYANTPWVLTTISTAADGAKVETRVIGGGPTGSEGVAVPVVGLQEYSLVPGR
ncbi:MAG: hypothetical protein U1E08_00130 [Coriobacteriia bacterium]|nr:hypothetical protein [Actinomycetota bacterium]MDZ4166095.1 hypothetical protein [Coriobacteriia bacterium]